MFFKEINVHFRITHTSFFYNLIYFWLCWSPLLHRLFSSCGEGYSLVAVQGLLIALASLVEHGLDSTQVSVVAVCCLSSCSARVLEHRLGSVAHRLVCSTASGIFLDK